MSKSVKRLVDYVTECKSGCGVLTLTLSGYDKVNANNGRWIRCAECRTINYAEKQTPSDE